MRNDDAVLNETGGPSPTRREFLALTAMGALLKQSAPLKPPIRRACTATTHAACPTS